MEQGNFQDALMNFMALEGRTDSSQQLITSGRNLFNIGQTYLALKRMEMAAKVQNSLREGFFNSIKTLCAGDLRDSIHEPAGYY